METKDAEVWTQAPDYDHFLFLRMYSPVGMSQSEIKCSIAFGKQYYKTKQLDDGSQPAGSASGSKVIPCSRTDQLVQLVKHWLSTFTFRVWGSGFDPLCQHMGHSVLARLDSVVLPTLRYMSGFLAPSIDDTFSAKD